MQLPSRFYAWGGWGIYELWYWIATIRGTFGDIAAFAIYLVAFFYVFAFRPLRSFVTYFFVRYSEAISGNNYGPSSGGKFDLYYEGKKIGEGISAQTLGAYAELGDQLAANIAGSVTGGKFDLYFDGEKIKEGMSPDALSSVAKVFSK